jgi:hypothetical protein
MYLNSYHFVVHGQPTSNSIYFKIPFRFDQPRNEQKFTGREGILYEINERLRVVDRKIEPRQVVLIGTGGIGKTQIAIEYVHRHHDEFSAVFWIDATSLATTSRSFDAAAKIILEHIQRKHLEEIPAYRLFLDKVIRPIEPLNATAFVSSKEGGNHKIVDAVKGWFLESGNHNWLLVFDNLDDLESFQIRNYIPHGQWGSILLTSRRPESGITWPNITVGEMNETESLELLRKSANIRVEFSQEGQYNKTTFWVLC